ncbi:hypothetical protein DS2_18478 [Catenovulum agarivorans DS-2]|uniref:Hydrazine synthase alpha subunit middle domain-containing protein n=1 Tax=Catenovulum agarivorans DS-2 TaxID=1328313 RepID=W7Q896_9ALTE|nr:hypothetical protein [Catenovulum agarivorans]EWH08206.1 hypothetical protein DS2_18478 [Catenovulum agarivorans DS-2]
MNPVLSCSGLALTFLLLLGCTQDTQTNDESGKQLDPVLVEYPVVFLRRSASYSVDEQTIQASHEFLNPTKFNPGAAIWLKHNASVLSKATNISDAFFQQYFGENAVFDIKDLTLAPNGDELLFSLKVQFSGDDVAELNEQQTWNIWSYQHSSKSFYPVIENADVANLADDFSPKYLPDGRIVFASTRQQTSKALLLDEGRPQYLAQNDRRNATSINLHVMDDLGQNIQQITFNMNHDLYPHVLDDGSILYNRWDTNGNNRISLYRVNPDGSENSYVYGWSTEQHSINENLELPSRFRRFINMDDGNLLWLAEQEGDGDFKIIPMLLNITDYVEDNLDIAAEEVETTSTQKYPLLSQFNFDFNLVDENLSAYSGQLADLFPMQDGSGRLLLSLSLCRVIHQEKVKTCQQVKDVDAEEYQLAPPAYELWLYDPTNKTQQLVNRSTPSAQTEQTDQSESTNQVVNQIIEQAFVMQPYVAPAIKNTDGNISPELAAENLGVLDIASVFDMDGELDYGSSIAQLQDLTLHNQNDMPVKMVRFIRGVPMPPRDVRNVRGTDFGRSSGQLMREIIGYAPIEPDGSVKVTLPANTPFMLSLVDDNGQRIGRRHQHWISLTAGETLTCTGCHDRNTPSTHGRLDSQVEPINLGAAVSGAFNGGKSELVAEIGETMAQTKWRHLGAQFVKADMQLTDVWTDTSNSAAQPVLEEINLVYADLQTPQPEGVVCFSQWQFYCRISINYPWHIQPIWDLSREVFDPTTLDDENPVVIGNNQCSACHSTQDADGLAQVPPGQLDLSNSASTEQARHFTSYRELMFNDVEQEVVDGILQDKLIQQTDGDGNPVFELDEDGELILDENEQPIPVLTTIAVRNILSTGGARSSARFFRLFSEFDVDTQTVDHRNMLSPAELRLISEWLDLGGQYYNNPFYPQ